MSIRQFCYVALGVLLALFWAVAAPATPPVASSEPLLTPTPTPTPCSNNYNYTVSTGTIVSGTTLLPGSQCYSCIVNVALPFPFTFYGQTYTSANLSTDGNLQFTTTHLGPNTCPLPESLLGPAMMPHWDDLLDTSYHPPCQAAMGSDCGIYTSISGSAPNRIYNIQWRARFNSTSQHTANFEIRLYENSPYFEYIYGWVSYRGGNASIGVQDGGCRVTAYSCNTWNNIQPGTHIGWGTPPGGSPTPTPTCCNDVTGTINSSCEGTSYRYTFGLTNSCPITTTGSGGLFFEVSPNSTGPWTSPLHIDYFNYQVPPGYSESSGSMWSGGLPPGNNWFRHRLYLAGSCWTVNVTSAPQPACVTGTVTPGTVPPTSTPTHTRTTTATATPCPQNYVYATATATIVPGATDIGNHCDDCLTQITLPFPYQLYDQTFTQVGLDSNGKAHFPTGISVFPVECFPQPGITYTIFPYWEDLRTDCVGCGIYTSVSGTAPNRIFNIEWRANYFPGSGTANFELRLYEGQTRFDVIYGVLTAGNTGTLSGVQKDTTHFTQYFCNGQGGDANNGRLVVYTLPVCVTPTAIPPTYTPSPVATTATPETTHTTTVTGTPVSCNLSFTDMPPDNTFYTQVRCLACRGIVSGYSDGTFRPNNQVTRGQLAKMVSNAAGFSEPVSGQTFQDVPPNHTFYEFIQRLTIRGYMTGYVCGGAGEPCEVGNMPYFRPFANATRGQTSKIVSNAAGYSEIPTDQTFEDVPPAHTFYNEIQRLASRNIMGGYPCGNPGEPCLSGKPYFRPGNDVTRGQSSKIVANTFFPDCQMR